MRASSSFGSAYYDAKGWDELMAHALGALGSVRTNFDDAAYARAGFEDAAREVQSLWISGGRQETAAGVPDGMLLADNLIGTQWTGGARQRSHLESCLDPVASES